MNTARSGRILTTLIAAPAIGVCLVATSCGGTGPASSGSLTTHPDPTVSVDLATGSTLEFYELNNRVVVSEFGHADHTPLAPIYLNLIKSSRLVDLFTAVRPDLPVPTALVDLQARYPAAASQIEPGAVDVQSVQVAEATKAPSGGAGAADGTTNFPKGASSSHPDVGSGAPPTSGGGKPSGPQPLTSCGNSCCDANWTQNTLCYPNMSGSTYQWYLFDYGWSYADDSYYQYWGAACAATGTSTFSISSQDGFGGTWSVPQGDYRWESDDPTCSGGGFCTQPYMTSSVNTQSNQHEHTYCGGFWQ